MKPCRDLAEHEFWTNKIYRLVIVIPDLDFALEFTSTFPRTKSKSAGAKLCIWPFNVVIVFSNHIMYK